MIVAAIGDTHLPRGSRALPEECVRRLAAADAILHTGDLTSLTALDELRLLGPPVHAVVGNADEPELQVLLPEQLIVELEDVRLGVVHVPGPRAGREARLAARFPGCDAVLYGHTHVPQVERRRLDPQSRQPDRAAQLAGPDDARARSHRGRDRADADPAPVRH